MEQRSMGFESVVVGPVPRAPRRRPGRPGRGRSYARVWSDPAVRRAERQADHRYDEWRRAFTVFLANLPATRRAELKRRLARPAAA